jgi:hypothetical protein
MLFHLAAASSGICHHYEHIRRLHPVVSFLLAAVANIDHVRTGGSQLLLHLLATDFLPESAYLQGTSGC